MYISQYIKSHNVKNVKKGLKKLKYHKNIIFCLILSCVWDLARASVRLRSAVCWGCIPPPVWLLGRICCAL